MPTTTPTQIQQTQYGFAPVVEPYALDLLGQAASLTDITNPENAYQQYMGDRFAQFMPMQRLAFENAALMQTSPQLQQGTALAGMAGLAGLGLQGQYKPIDVGTQSFTAPGAASTYMNPYMNEVLAPQLQAMQRQADIQRQTLGAQAAQAGAFGGARSVIGNQQLNAELMRQQQQATGQAYGQAFQQGMQQFNQEQQQRLANAQLGEQSRQFGSNLGLQGLGTALQGAQTIGALGQQQFGQAMGINQLQQQYGTQQQQQAQNILNQQYQDFLNAQNYPYKQLGFMSDIIRGVPLTQTGTTLYQAPPSAISQLAGLGLGAYGLSKMAKGGKTSSRPAGLPALVLSQIE